MHSMVTHSLAGVSMASVSMAGKEDKDDIVFYDRLIGDGKAYIICDIPITRQDSYEAEFIVPTSTTGAMTVFGAAKINHDGKAIMETIGTGSNTSSGNTQLLSICGVSDYGHYNDVGYVQRTNLTTFLTSVNIPSSYTSGGTTITVQFYKDGNLIKETTSPDRWPSDYRHFSIFARAVYNTSESEIKEIQLLSKSMIVKKVRVYKNGINIYLLRPCIYRGEAGMYDVVNEVFYGNANTEGSFSVAND